MDYPQNELKIIKKLLILQLLYAGVPVQNIIKATGMSTKTLYKFIPKNVAKVKKKTQSNK